MRKGGRTAAAASTSVQQAFADAVRHQQAGRLDDAVAAYRRVLRRADFPEVHFNLGMALGRQGLIDDALACFRRAIERRPDYLAAHNNLGTALREQGRLDEAIDCYRRALEHNPGVPELHFNLGNALKAQGRPAEAAACFRNALARRPDYVDAHHNLSLALLAAGDYSGGWEEFEWRWKIPHMSGQRRDFPQPQWRGEPAGEKTLLIHAEQGFGDTIQFCRFAPLAGERGLRVVLEVQPALVRLLRGMARIDRVVGRGEPLPPFDFHCPLMSMPLALRTGATIPAAPTYLHADPAAIVMWRDRLATRAGGAPRIGLVWAGNSYLHAPVQAALDRRRSVSPDRLAPLFAIAGLHFVSLQKGSPAPTGANLTDLMGDVGDFADTAALIANLDLVISVDTAVAHLAAALGKPVWLLNRFDGCWRWLAGRDDSPWYPGLRIYRQPRPGDWDPVIDAVCRDLSGLAWPS